tara:strand:- start:4686 stop:4916 length:231 start_codon:yes stop_codon:yes gene_type:complete
MLVSTIVPRCLRVIKTVHDLLPARIIAVTGGWPAEVLVFMCIFFALMNVFLFLWNVKVHEVKKRKSAKSEGGKKTR